MAAIAFVGDSFCAAYNHESWKSRECTTWQKGVETPTYLDIVAQTNGYTLYPFGFGGKSWWYSRCRFIEELERLPKSLFADQLETIVFCHTNPGRINNAWNRELSNTDTDSSFAIDYYKRIFDGQFNEWAQQQWFKEIAEKWGHLKTIHFHCFTETVPLSHLLPGMVYTTPLIWVSIGELTGSDNEIEKKLIHDNRSDSRFNHLNAHNNKVLAEFILGAIYDYRPGQYEIDTSNFDIINPKATRWPNPGYGTE
jgi:hypothetical protein